jgi:hypothetical protein
MSSSRRDTVNNRRRPGSWWRAWWRGKFASRALVLAISLPCVASLMRPSIPFTHAERLITLGLAELSLGRLDLTIAGKQTLGAIRGV